MAVSALLVAACGGPAPEDESAARQSELFFGEIEVFADDVDEEFRIVREDFLVAEATFAECVIALGYDYTPRSLEIAYVDLAEDGRLPSLADVRRTYGYGVVAAPDHTLGVSVSVSGGLQSGDQRRFFESVIVNNEGSCGDRYYSQDVQEQLMELRFAQGAPPAEWQVHPDVLAAEDDWVRCMAELGYPFPNRQAPALEIMQRLEQLEQSADDERVELGAYELEVAAADTDCFLATVNPVLVELAGS